MIKTIKNFNLRTIALSGQCFRMFEVYENVFHIYSTDKFLKAKRIKKDVYDFDCTNSEWKFYEKYFDLNNDYSKYKKVCKKNDTYLKKCIEYSDGLRILNQDKFEMVISFIISQRKSVKAISTSIERLCRLCGKKVKDYYAFPNAYQILKTSSEKLSTCGLGYRQPYIIDFCKDYAQGKYNLDDMDKLTNDELLEKLLSIKGVGIKVASCIALFAYHRMDICPKDVWINRVLNSNYGGKIPSEYEKYAGIIQQYWFNYSKNLKKV